MTIPAQWKGKRRGSTQGIVTLKLPDALSSFNVSLSLTFSVKWPGKKVAVGEGKAIHLSLKVSLVSAQGSSHQGELEVKCRVASNTLGMQRAGSDPSSEINIWYKITLPIARWEKECWTAFDGRLCPPFVCLPNHNAFQ